uniref:G-rich sequence factor 1-like isoform x1 n=1 Tax=Tetraselmis sp. GSL018 TaxID=582737 RepID=A0A061RGC4_9CHLO
MSNISISGDWYTLNNGTGRIDNETIVKVKGLPLEAKQIDLIHFFDGFNFRANGVQIVTAGLHRPTGEGFVDFETPEEAARAITTKDGSQFGAKFGDRFVKLLSVGRREMQDALNLCFGGDGVLKMKGIPYKATLHEIRQFFAGYLIKPNGISIILQAGMGGQVAWHSSSLRAPRRLFERWRRTALSSAQHTATASARCSL